jgi:hypothetical protein
MRSRSTNLQSARCRGHPGARAWWPASRLSSGGMTLRTKHLRPTGLRHLAIVGPAGGDTLGALRSAAMQQHHVGMLDANLVEPVPDRARRSSEWNVQSLGKRRFGSTFQSKHTRLPPNNSTSIPAAECSSTLSQKSDFRWARPCGRRYNRAYSRLRRHSEARSIDAHDLPARSRRRWRRCK